MNIKEKDKKYIAGTYGRFDLEITSGKGATCYDEKGKKYIDFGSGIALNTFGFADDLWKDAVINQISKFQHTSNLYYTEPAANLAEKLCKKSGMEKVFFSNSGAEANECAIKCARKYSFDKYGEGRSNIITIKNSFHGRTVTTLSATGQDSFHTIFMPFTDGFLYAEPNIESLKEMIDDTVCAIMFETVQGEGGVNVLADDFVEYIIEVAKKKDILTIVDEVQTGNGRTGKYFSYMHYNFIPDIVTTAKGLAGGLPIGATLFSKKTEDVFTPGTHGSTFGGNPVSCAAAISVIDRIDDALLSDVSRKSNYIIEKLKNCNGVKEISGRGLMLGIKMEKPAKEIVNEAMNKGLILLTAKDKVRLLPPLNISDKELNDGIDILMEVLSK